MRSVPTALNAQLLKEANFLANLVEMQISSNVYFTDLDIDVVYGGHTYLSRGLTFSGAEYSLSPQIDKISFEIDNVGLEFSAFVLSQEVRGKKCIISKAAMTDKDDAVANGGFETAGAGGSDDFASWFEYESGGSTNIRDTSELYSGTASFKQIIDGSNSEAYVYQALTLVPGLKYRLSLKYRNSASGKTARIMLYDSGFNGGLRPDGTFGTNPAADTIDLPNSTSWASYSIDFYAHADYSSYLLYLSRGSAASSSIWFDDVSLVPLQVPPAKVLAVTTVFTGILDACRINHQRAVFEVYNPLIFWKRKTPRRIHQPSCPWPFKGSLCAYAGAETWCDQSFARCTALGNTINFGGFRYLPDLQDKQLWWGRKP